MKFAFVCVKLCIFVQLYNSNDMRKILIIIALVLLAMPMFAQTIESVDVKKAPNGLFKTKGGDCLIEGNVQNGLKEGSWMEYYTSPALLPKRIVTYEKGKKNGVSLEMDKTGTVTKKTEYKNDVLDGQVSEWYRGGRLSKSNTYKNGVMDGEQILCYEKGGELEVSHYKNGQRDGVSTWFYESGQKKMTIEYKNGQFDGKQESFYPDGSLKSETVYKAGKQQGKTKTYAEKKK